MMHTVRLINNPSGVECYHHWCIIPLTTTINSSYLTMYISNESFNFGTKAKACLDRWSISIFLFKFTIQCILIHYMKREGGKTLYIILFLKINF